jgi:hypothetical protein
VVLGPTGTGTRYGWHTSEYSLLLLVSTSTYLVWILVVYSMIHCMIDSADRLQEATGR